MVSYVGCIRKLRGKIVSLTFAYIKRISKLNLGASVHFKKQTTSSSVCSLQENTTHTPLN